MGTSCWGGTPRDWGGHGYLHDQEEGQRAINGGRGMVPLLPEPPRLGHLRGIGGQQAPRVVVKERDEMFLHGELERWTKGNAEPLLGGFGVPREPHMSPLTLEAMNCPSPGGKVTEARSSTTSTVYTGLLQEGHGELGTCRQADGHTGGEPRDTQGGWG